MPRKKPQGNLAVEEPPTQDLENDVTSATDTDAFEIYSEPAPEDYSPERATPGRERKPSYFDEVLRSDGVFGAGWQRVPVQNEEHKQYVHRELNRAKLYLNGRGKLDGESDIGLDIDLSKEDALYYKSRVAQKRERKNSNASLDDNAEAEGFETGTGDDDE